MRTTKVKASQAMYELLNAIHEQTDSNMALVSDRVLNAMFDVRLIAEEYQDGDPRGRHAAPKRVPGTPLTGYEQAMFRA